MLTKARAKILKNCLRCVLKKIYPLGFFLMQTLFCRKFYKVTLYNLIKQLLKHIERSHISHV